jgi:hypothetical protein
VHFAARKTGRLPGSGCLGTSGLFWAPRCVFRAAKCTSGTFPRIKSPGGIPGMFWDPQCAFRAARCTSGTFHRIRFPGWALLSNSGALDVFFKWRKLHLGRFPGSSPLGTLGLFWTPPCVFRAGKCTSGIVPRIESPGHSRAVLGFLMCFSGGKMHIRDVSPAPVSRALLSGSRFLNALFRRRKLYLGRFPDWVFWALLGCSGLPRAFSGAKCTSRDVSQDLVSWALLGCSGIRNVFCGRRDAHPGRFPGSGVLGVPEQL